ncbi:olee1-like protein [Medicago truncatula]|nr:olee1-like protein [Medicago truncatula]
MARSFAIVALIVSAFCFSYVLAAPKVAPKAATDKVNFFVVYGQIYCDPCGFDMQTRISKPLGGVKVTFECTKGEKNVTLVKETTTHENGIYNFQIEGAHEEEVCKVKVNGKGPCTYNIDKEYEMTVPTKNLGVTTSSLQRFVNPIQFSPDANRINSDQCGKLGTELGLDKIDVPEDED